MQTFTYVLTVEAETKDQADLVVDSIQGSAPGPDTDFADLDSTSRPLDLPFAYAIQVAEIPSVTIS